jgi:MFS transporter, FHS family, glucose/mannose:H+ symporter
VDASDGRPVAEGTGLLTALPSGDAALTAAAPGRVRLAPPAVFGIGASFLLMGVVVSMYGPLLRLLMDRFGVSLPVAGSIISVHFGASMAGVLLAMRALGRRAGRDTFAAGLAVGGVGCLVAAFAPTWPVFLAGIAVIGIGFGALIIGLNQLVAYSAGARRAALLNGLNGAYSGGAVIGPVLVATLATQHLAWLFVAGGLVSLVLIPSAFGVSGRLPVDTAAQRRPGLLVWTFIVAFVLYVAVEVGAAGWMASHLESNGLSATGAAAATSAFFLALVSGRLLSTLIPGSVPEWVVVLTGSVVATVAVLAATVPAIAVGAYVITGLALAPIFPTGITWLARLRPGDSRATAWLFPAASVGGTLGPGAIGLVIGGFGLFWTPVVLAAVAATMAACFFVARRSAA